MYPSQFVFCMTIIICTRTLGQLVEEPDFPTLLGPFIPSKIKASGANWDVRSVDFKHPTLSP
jgi:hypothetical protein